jgi:tellurium resistance protein TerZ
LGVFYILPIIDKYTLGLAWDSVPVAAGKKPIDLDASCLMLGDDLQQIDKVYYGGLKSKDGSMKHHGDERTGASDGDDEEIEVCIP